MHIPLLYFHPQDRNTEIFSRHKHQNNKKRNGKPSHSNEQLACTSEKSAHTRELVAYSKENMAYSKENMAYSSEQAAYSKELAAYTREKSAYSRELVGYIRELDNYSSEKPAYSRKFTISGKENTGSRTHPSFYSNNYIFYNHLNPKAMNDRQNAKLSMYNVVVSVMDDNTAKVATVPALVTVAASFKTTAEAISNTAEQQATITTGITPDKNDTRETLRSTTVNLAGILYAYANSVNDIVLKERSKITYSMLRVLKDDELAERAQTIHDDANTNIASLPPFGITAAVLTSYQTLIDTYSAKSPAPRAAQSQQVALTEQLKTLFRQADSTLKESMDKIMLNFKTTDPQFFNTYTAAREIIDAGSSKTKAVGTVIADPGNIPVDGAIITVQDRAYTATSNASGTYELPIPIPGTYNLICSHPTFGETIQKNVVITLGESTTVNFVLKS